MSLDILKTKISEVDKAVESDLMEQVKKFYSMAKYENGRFRFPDLNEVSNAHLKSISDRKILINDEIGRVCKTAGYIINEKEYLALEKLVCSIFDENRYIARLDKFIEGMEMSAGRYGLVFESSHNSVSLSRAGYSAGVKNLTRQAKPSVVAELKLHSDKGHDKNRVISWLIGLAEIVVLVFLVWNSWLWVKNPEGNFEPLIVLAGLALPLIEWGRRWLQSST